MSSEDSNLHKEQGEERERERSGRRSLAFVDFNANLRLSTETRGGRKKVEGRERERKRTIKRPSCLGLTILIRSKVVPAKTGITWPPCYTNKAISS